jgi:hypothetical protein
MSFFDSALSHDARFVLPLARAALAASNNALKLFFSPWSPPAWMIGAKALVENRSVSVSRACAPGWYNIVNRKQHMRSKLRVVSLLVLAGTVLSASSGASASSHGEAPFIKGNPRVDATDFYMFNSYESGREGYVTIIANYYPLQDPYGGPNYFTLDPDAVYQIHIDSNGDAREDLTFSFKMRVQNNDIAINVGGVAHGHWTGCHAVFYDLNAPPYGDINLLNQQKNYF